MSKQESNVEVVSPETYDVEYFEFGIQSGKSGYRNYTWLPELTIKMAHHLIQLLPIRVGDCVLDYGCAKGYLVKALRILEVEAYGVDVSSYAIGNVDSQVRNFCDLISGVSDSDCFRRKYQWMISKDVFEHLTEAELRDLLIKSGAHVEHMFVAIPLGLEDGSGFVIPDYDRDVTHVTKKPLGWWRGLFESTGWRVQSVSHHFKGVKDTWTSLEPNGNAFFVLDNKN